MSNTEWNERRPGAYSVWGEDVHPHHTFEVEEEEYEEHSDEEYDEETTEEEDSLSFYEEMLAEEILADSIVRDVSLAVDTMKLSLSTPKLTITEGVSVTFNYSDKATITQEVTDGQLSLTVQENTALQSIKICVDNRTWTIPLDAFSISPPLMPKKR